MKKWLWLLLVLIPFAVWADTAVKDMTADTAPAASDIVYEVKDPTGTPLDRKLSLGNVPAYVTIQTGATYTFGTSYNNEYVFNDYSSGVTYTLPTAAAGKQFCARNYTTRTGAVQINTSAAGQYIDLDGANTASGGHIQSGGALGDSVCLVGADSTHWVAFVGKGTWTKD